MKNCINIFFITIIFAVLSSGCTVCQRAHFEKIFEGKKVIYCNDFENSEVGEYDNHDLSLEWRCAKKLNPEAFCRTHIIQEDDGNKALSVLYPKEKYGVIDTGAQWLMPIKNRESATLEYDIKPMSGINFVKGAKLPGLIGMRGDEMASGGIDADGTNSWTVRLMTGQYGKIKGYIYPMYRQTPWGNAYHFDYGLKKYSHRYLVPGVWNHIKIYVQMNTIGKKDGVFRAWLDGELSCEVKNLSFRSIKELSINYFYFSSFYGGNDSSWATTKDEIILFDNFVIY